MRSVIVYLRDIDLKTIDLWLDKNYVKAEPGLGHRWIDQRTEYPVLYIETALVDELYQDPGDLKSIEERLGAHVTAVVVVEVSGRCSGRSELVRFLKHLMSQFNCIVQDENSTYSWTKEELDCLNSERRRFFNF
jgi:hypothetical protein